MPVVDTATQNQILDGWLGPNRAAGSPDEYEIEGWIDDPRTVGAQEADFGGYAPATWDADDWGPADGGQTSTTSVVSLGTPTSEGTDAVRYWALRNTTTAALVFCAPLANPVNPVGSNPVEILPTVFWAG